MDEKPTRMLFATLAFSALAALLLVGPANAYFVEGGGVQAVSTQSQDQQPSPSGAAPTIPYLSQGNGVDASQFGGSQATPRLSGPHAALQTNRHEKTAVAPLPHGAQVVMSPPSEEEQPLGLTGDSALTRQQGGLAASSASNPPPTTYPSYVIGAGGSQWDGHTLPPTVELSKIEAPQVTVKTSGSDFDWTSFGAGAGMVALLAAVLSGVVLTVRRRHSVGLP